MREREKHDQYKNNEESNSAEKRIAVLNQCSFPRQASEPKGLDSLNGKLLAEAYVEAIQMG